MNLFGGLAEYKFAVISTGYRNAALYDITLFKSHNDGRKFMRECAREMQKKIGDELIIDNNGCSIIVSDKHGKYMRWTIDLTRNLLNRVEICN